MSDRHPTMMEPPVEDLLDRVDSKFNQLGDGLGAIVPPQVTSVSRKPLSISLEEIAAGKITYHRIDADAAGEGPDGEGSGPAEAEADQ
jgi:DNA-directed RNA polymerase subunit omega